MENKNSILTVEDDFEIPFNENKNQIVDDLNLEKDINNSKNIDSYIDLAKQKESFVEKNLNIFEEKNKDLNYLSSDSKNSSTNTSYQDLPSNFAHDTIDKEKSILKQNENEFKIDIEKENVIKTKLLPTSTSLNFNSKCIDFLNKDNDSCRTKTDSLSYDYKKDIDKSKICTDPFLNYDYFKNSSVKLEPNLYTKHKIIDSCNYKLNSYSNDMNKKFTRDLKEIENEFREKKSYFSPINQLDDIKHSKISSTITNSQSLSFNPIDKTYIEPVTSFYRSTAVSAFETDPDVLLLKKNGTDKTTLSAVTQKYLSFNNLNVADKKLDEKFRSSETKFENDFLNIFSLKIKKNSSETDLKTKPNEAYKLNDESRNDTVESDHLDSDYAKCPQFPSEVYGSRPGIETNFKEGIYNRKSVDKNIKLTECERTECDKTLDPESLKIMDKKLKKLIKKNLKEDLKSHIVSEQLKNPGNTISWEIPVDKTNMDQGNETLTTLNQTIDGSSHPYLPLRDVPIHDLVKKLREEFELEGDLSCIPDGLNEIYHIYHSRIKNDSFGKDLYPIKLDNFVKNPAKVFIENLPTDQSNEANIDQSKIDDILEHDQKDLKSDEKLVRKHEIQQTILDQKLKHEKRIKALEKLIKIEKLQAHKLKSLLNSIQTESDINLIYESFENFKKSYLDQSRLDQDFLDKLENEKILNVEKKKSELVNFESGNDLCQSPKVELPISDNESTSCPENGESGIESSESSSEQNKQDDQMPIKSWFFPINSTKTTSNKEQNQNRPSFKMFLKEKNVSDTLNKKNFDYVQITDQYEKKSSLQEAFQIHKYEFLVESRNRVKEIKLKAARRQVAAELKMNSHYNNLEQKFSKMNSLSKKRFDSNVNKENVMNNKKYSYFTIEKFSRNRHTMSSEEIKAQTKKKYQKLPEVQQKQLRKKLEESKVRNRIKSNIFKKAIQQKVLMSGPNFNLNFKALDDKNFL